MQAKYLYTLNTQINLNNNNCTGLDLLDSCGPREGTDSEAHTHTFPLQQANGSQVHVLYSTPTCYLWELNKANLTWYLGQGTWEFGVGLICSVVCDCSQCPRAGQ